MPGRCRAKRCIWCNGNHRVAKKRRRWLVLGPGGRIADRSICISVMGSPTVNTSGSFSWRYWTSPDRRAKPLWSSSGTMLAGTSANASSSGSAPTITPRKQRVNRAYWSMAYRSKVPGSIRLNPVGFMPNEQSVSLMATCRRLSYGDDCVPTSRPCRSPIHSNYELHPCTRATNWPGSTSNVMSSSAQARACESCVVTGVVSCAVPASGLMFSMRPTR